VCGCAGNLQSRGLKWCHDPWLAQGKWSNGYCYFYEPLQEKEDPRYVEILCDWLPRTVPPTLSLFTRRPRSCIPACDAPCYKHRSYRRTRCEVLTVSGDAITTSCFVWRRCERCLPQHSPAPCPLSFPLLPPSPLPPPPPHPTPCYCSRSSNSEEHVIQEFKANSVPLL
jgi:hypothetical protein